MVVASANTNKPDVKPFWSPKKTVKPVKLAVCPLGIPPLRVKQSTTSEKLKVRFFITISPINLPDCAKNHPNTNAIKPPKLPSSIYLLYQKHEKGDSRGAAGWRVTKELIQSARKILAWDHTSNCFPPFLIVSLRFGNGNTSSLLSHRHLLSGLMLSNGWPTVYSHSSDSRFARLRAFSWEASQKQPPHEPSEYNQRSPPDRPEGR